MYRKYYSYNDMPVPVKKDVEFAKKEPSKPPAQKPKENKRGIENDDLILIAVFVILIMNDCDDKLLLLALAAIFFMDK